MPCKRLDARPRLSSCPLGRRRAARASSGSNSSKLCSSRSSAASPSGGRHRAASVRSDAAAYSFLGTDGSNPTTPSRNDTRLLPLRPICHAGDMNCPYDLADCQDVWIFPIRRDTRRHVVNRRIHDAVIGPAVRVRLSRKGGGVYQIQLARPVPSDAKPGGKQFICVGFWHAFRMADALVSGADTELEGGSALTNWYPLHRPTDLGIPDWHSRSLTA